MKNRKKAIVGITGSGKTTMLIDIYKELIQKHGVNTNDILVLLRNRGQNILWKEQLEIQYSSKLRITSYFGFVQGELQKFWPIIVNNLSKRFDKIEPTFITIEMSQFLMGQIVEESRMKGKLQTLQTDNERIVIELLHNISKAAMTGKDFKDIGDTLFNAKANKDIFDRELFSQIQEICDIYIEKCKELGVLDYGLSIDIYTKILLKDKLYRSYFLRSTRHIIVDDLEEGIPVEIKMIHELMDELDSLTIAYNTDGSIGRAMGACPELVEDLILSQCEVTTLDKSLTLSPNLIGLSKLLTESTKEHDSINISKLSLIEKDLRSDMLKSVGDKVIDLLGDGIPPNEIVIISPLVDQVTYYYIKKILNSKGYELTNLVRSENLTDDSYVKALITLACISHPQWGMYPSIDDMDLVLSMILDMDRIRSHLISLEISKQKPYTFPEVEELPPKIVNRLGKINIEKYDLLRKWIEDYKKTEFVSISRFFKKLLTEILIPLPDTEEHLEACRQLIDNCTQFLEIIGMTENNKEQDKIYLEFILRGMKAAQSLIEIRGKIHSKNVVLATPYSYLTMKQARAIQIWVDISSDDWFGSDVKEITNPHVFHPHWESSRVWTDQDNDTFRLKKGKVLITRLLNRCHSKVYFASSQLSRYGYEQDNFLNDRIDTVKSITHKE